MGRFQFIIFSTLISIFIYSSCRNKKVELVLVNSEDSFYVNKKTDFLIFYNYTTRQNNNYFSYYDPANNSIEIINLDTKKKFRSIDIPRNDSIEVNDLNDFLIHNFDTIILQYSYQISIIDTSGKIKHNQIINDPFSDEWPKTIYNSKGSLFPMHFDMSSSELIIQQYPGKYFSWSKGYYEMPIIASYNFQSRTFKDILVFYPEKYKKSYFGSASNIYHTVAGDKDVFSFEGDENLYVYNKQNGSFSSYNCKSANQLQYIKPLDVKYKDDINKKIDHYTVSPIYLKIIFDPYRNLFYRFFSQEVPLKNSDGTYNTNANKDLFLMVIDDKFNIVKEIKINDNEWYWSFVNSKGLYLQRIPKSVNNPIKLNEKKILFTIYDFHFN